MAGSACVRGLGAGPVRRLKHFAWDAHVCSCSGRRAVAAYYLMFVWYRLQVVLIRTALRFVTLLFTRAPLYSFGLWLLAPGRLACPRPPSPLPRPLFPSLPRATSRSAARIVPERLSRKLPGSSMLGVEE